MVITLLKIEVDSFFYIPFLLDPSDNKQNSKSE